MFGGGLFDELRRHVSSRAPIWTPLFLHYQALEHYVASRVPHVLERAGQGPHRVLDVGCGNMPYREHFSRDRRLERYDGADIAGSESLATLNVDPESQRISAPDESYDVIVSFQVLEHSASALELLGEFRRVLRPGGALFITLPFVFEYHAVPGDFRRWTHQGISQDLTAAGFRDVSVDPVETDLSSLLVINELYVSRYLGYRVTKPLFLAANAIGIGLERLLPNHRFHVIPLTLGAIATRT